MAKGKKRSFKLIERVDGHYWHLFHTLNDDEFIEHRQELFSILKKETGSIGSFSKPDDLDELGYTESAEKLREIEREFDISADSFWAMNDGEMPLNPIPVFMTMEEEDDGRQYLMLRIDPELTEKEYKQIWPWIESSQKYLPTKRTRSRSAEDTELLYAVHRARKKGMTYTDISLLLEEGELPLYPRKISMGYNALSKFHNKYYPSKKDS